MTLLDFLAIWFVFVGYNVDCFLRVEFEYLNLEWQEALFTETFDDPQSRMSFVVSNKQLPCNDEYIFVAKAYGVNGKKNNF